MRRQFSGSKDRHVVKMSQMATAARQEADAAIRAGGRGNCTAAVEHAFAAQRALGAMDAHAQEAGEPPPRDVRGAVNYAAEYVRSCAKGKR